MDVVVDCYSKPTMIILFNALLAFITESCACRLYADKVYGGTLVDCSRENLTTIPTHLPTNTTSLDLSRNNISAFSCPKDTTFEKLKYLDLSYNHLFKLESGTFDKFERLQELFWHNNKLTLDNTSFPDDVFQPLQNLRKLHLHNNDQREEGFYPEDAIAKLSGLEELKIDSFSETYFGAGFSQLFNLQRLILGFEGCKLKQIQNRTFENFIKISLLTLDLDECPVSILEIASFYPLMSLKFLHFSNLFRVTPTTAVQAMYGFRGRNLSSIEMNNIFNVRYFRNEKVKERVLSKNVIVYLKEVCVEKFSMVNVELLWIDKAILVDSVFSKCIKYFDLSMNDLYGDVHFPFVLSLMSNLIYLNMSSYADGSRSRRRPNQFQTFSYANGIQFTIPETLEVTDFGGLLSKYGLDIHQNIYIYGAKFSIAGNGILIKETFIGLENLTVLDISGNKCSDMNLASFDNLSNLETLIIEDGSLKNNYLLNYGERLLRPLKRLKILNLNNNNIRLLDTNMLPSSQIEEINLSTNRFESIPFDLVSIPLLHHLDLSFNSLAVLSDTDMKLLDDLALRNNLTLNLEGNLLACGCQNLEFIMWLYNTNVQVIRASTYICQMSDGAVTNISYIRDHYEEIWMSCNGRLSLYTTTVLLAVFLIVILGMYLILRRKTLLANIFLRMFGYGPLPQVQGRTDFLNDAYIGYSDADYQYICHTVRDHLENKHGLKLFIRDRDTIPGGQIADDIITGIDSSWKTFIYITATFLNDQWCRFIINQVVYSSGRRPHGSVILVLSDDVRRGDIDPALLNVVEERNIFFVERYTGDEDGLWVDVSKTIKQKLTR